MKLGRRRQQQPENKADAQTLMNGLMNEAVRRLKRDAGFAPFGAWLDRQGSLTLDLGNTAAGDAVPELLIEAVAGDLRQQAASGGLRAGGVASDVRFGKRGSDERRTAVLLHIEHEDGYSVDIYVPYRLRKPWRKTAEGKWRVRLSHPVGQESARVLWTDGERLLADHADQA